MKSTEYKTWHSLRVPTESRTTETDAAYSAAQNIAMILRDELRARFPVTGGKAPGNQNKIPHGSSTASRSKSEQSSDGIHVARGRPSTAQSIAQAEKDHLQKALQESTALPSNTTYFNQTPSAKRQRVQVVEPSLNREEMDVDHELSSGSTNPQKGEKSPLEERE
jgi:ribosomal protein L16 Arg81 hydroxylase